MRHIKLGESTVMQEFERIAAEKGWIVTAAEWTLMPDGRYKSPSGQLMTKEQAEVLAKAHGTKLPTPTADEPTYRGMREYEKSLMEKPHGGQTAVPPWESMPQSNAPGTPGTPPPAAAKPASVTPEQALTYLKQVWDKLTPQQKARFVPGKPNPTLEDATRAMMKDPTAMLKAFMPRSKPARRKPKYDDLVKDVQSVLVGSKLPVGKRGPDGFWGPATAQAWNKWIDQTGNDAIAKADPRGTRPPSDKDMYWVAYTYGRAAQSKSKAQPAGSGLINPFEGGKVTPDLKDPWAKESTDMTRNIRTADDAMPPEHVPTGLVKQPHRSELGKAFPQTDPATSMQDIDKMLAGVKEPDQEPASYQGSLIQQVQKLLEQSGEDVGPKAADGMWGWFTARAWNAFAKKHPEASLPQTTEKQPPPNAVLRRMLGAVPAVGTGAMPPEPKPPLHLIKEPHMTQPWQYPSGPELVPKASAAIVSELVALANDLDEMGETKIAEAVDKQLTLYKEAVDSLYDITGETGEQLIGEAHPGGGPTMAPAKDEGGKVETIVEEQKKMLKVVDKSPTGKQAAFVAKQLVALANRLDAEGKTEAALLVDKTLSELREGSPRPFVVSGLRKEAWAFLPFLIKALVVAFAAVGTTRAAKYLSSKADGIGTDSKDLLKVSEGLVKEFPTNQELSKAHDNLQSLLGFATSVPDAVPQSGSKEEIGKYLVSLSAFEKALPDIQAAVQNVNANVPMGRFVGKSSLDEHLADLIASFNKNKEAVGKLAQYGQSSGKTPSPEAAKEEQPYEKQLRETMQATHKRFKGTITTLLSGLVKALQDPAKEAEANRMLKGKLNETIDWLKTLSQQKEPTTLAELTTLKKYNDILWNGYLGPLRKNPKLADVFASIKRDRLVREAAPPKPAAAPGIPGAPVGPLDQATKPTKPVAKPGARRLVRKSRPELQRLQQLMLGLNLPLGKRQADGVWGPYTANAWNMLDHKSGGRLGAAPSEKTEGPPANLIERATRVANVLMQRGAAVDIGSGIMLPTGAFASVQTFLRALATKRGSGIDTSGNLDTAANRKRALELLRGFAGRLDTEDVQLDLAAKLGDQGAQRLSQQVDALLDALGAAEAGIPSYRGSAGQPGQQGSGSRRQPYGRGEGRDEGLGDLGTLEGGGRGGRGGRGRGGERMPTSMSLEDQVYNIPDVSGFVNDPAQFAAWAQRFWMSKGGEEGAPYVIAHKVIQFLRNQIAVLQNSVMKAPVRDREDLQSTLRQRHEAVNDVYTTLPKGR